MTAYLVTIDTQSGIQPQIWHGDKKSGFVGCAHLKPVTEILLPDREEAWTVNDAIAFAHANPDIAKDPS